MTRQRVLLVGESVALAHASRPVVLAGLVDPERYEVHVAFDPRHEWLCEQLPEARFHALGSIAPEQFLNTPPGSAYGLHDLRGYVEDELRLLDEVDPALVISDFRYTMSTSATVSRSLHATLVNAHWNPHRALGFAPHPPVPETLARRLRTSIPGRAVRRLARSARRGAPSRAPDDVALLNEVRQSYGLPPLTGYLQMLVDADHVLHPEPPGLIEIEPDAAPAPTFIGNVTWSPPAPLPPAVRELDEGENLIYVTAGSTGDTVGLVAVVRGLAALDVTVLVATAGRYELPPMPSNVIVEPLVAGSAVCDRASVVVCSGGSGTAYQALAARTPVVAQYSNLDQYITSQVIARHGAGLATSAEAPSAEVVALVARVVGDDSFSEAAGRLAGLFAATPVELAFPSFVDRVLAEPAMPEPDVAPM